MKNNSMKKLLSLLLCIVLIAATALFTTGCGDSETETPPVTTEATETAAAASAANGNVLGEGATVFTVTVTDLEGVETAYEVHTDADTVGEALLALGLLDGEQGDYGLYITAVNGIPLKWEEDGKYWAFYIDGEYALTGVDTTNVTVGATYSFKPE